MAREKLIFKLKTLINQRILAFTILQALYLWIFSLFVGYSNVIFLNIFRKKQNILYTFWIMRIC